MIKRDYKRILVPVDGSKQSKKAIEKACYLAQSTGLELVALYVIDTPDLPSEFEHQDEITYQQIYELLKKEGSMYFDDVEKKANEYQISFTKKILDGHPADEIIKESKKNDLIIMGYKGKTGLDHLLMGSTTEKVARHTESDIMVIR